MQAKKHSKNTYQYSAHKEKVPHLGVSDYMNEESKKTPAFRFYKSAPWDKWWTEFHTLREKTGRMTYLTAWSFAKAKGKNVQEVNWIYRAIGPKPVALPHQKKKRNPLPYLGDWQQLRSKAYFYDKESVDKMRVVVAEKLDGMEAGRGSATVVLDLIAKWMRYDDSIDEAFGSSPVQEGLSNVMQEKRADLFFKLKRKTLNAVLELVEKYLQCHGISSDGISDLGQLALAVANSATKSTINGMVAGAALGQDSPALAALNRAMFQKAQIFDLPLPASLVEEHEK